MRSDSPTRALKEHTSYCRVPRLKEQWRSAIAQRYGGPVAWVRQEDDLVHPEANVKTSRGILVSLRAKAQAGVHACLHVVDIILLQAGRN
jgi:hypothetical protein